MKSSGIGGMAVIEGVMMKNKEEYAVAVRKPNKGIIVDKKKFKSTSDKIKIFKLPVLRGIAAFIDSMVVGINVMNYSSSLFDDETQTKKGKNNKKKNTRSKNTKSKNTKSKNTKTNDVKDKDKGDGLLMFLTILLSLAIAISLFMVLPFYTSLLLMRFIESKVWLSVIEGVIRLSIFIIYVMLISQIEDIKRVFMYHGAEHKAINCIENGFELTVENVKWQSKEHKRCGTSFMLYVMIISIIFFVFINVDTLWLRMLIRLLLVPIIAGVSYEFIRMAGNSESKLVNVLSKPGLVLQKLTTKEPDKKMIEVAIKAVEAVFDWEEYLAKNTDTKEDLKETVNLEENVEEVDLEEDEEDILKALDKYLDLDED
ncbi:MAG TPA: DUF1385 domain-containing protein [Clostridiales bacterium]|nr:DUF1385 domain-containing protein [Clostridiales bacterium]